MNLEEFLRTEPCRGKRRVTVFAKKHRIKKLTLGQLQSLFALPEKGLSVEDWHWLAVQFQYETDIIWKGDHSAIDRAVAWHQRGDSALLEEFLNWTP